MNIPLVPLTADEPLKIVHADNYFEWPSSQPWSYQTSDEFIVALSRLIDACNRCAFPTELIIRVKPNFDAKGELDEATLNLLLPPAEGRCRWALKKEGSFLEDTAQGHMVVASHCTTIEEALLIGRPVLQWGMHQRYAHVSPSERVAYFPRWQDDLTMTLQTIYHDLQTNPPAKEAFSAYSWPSSVPDFEGVLT